jgi:hypothetical protein
MDDRQRSIRAGLAAYRHAVGLAFDGEIDYAMLIKKYGPGPTDAGRYSPPVVTDVEPHVIRGYPDEEHISTSYVERANLTMRMNMRRFTRLTNAFSKRVEMHEHAVALHFMHYNFCRAHETLTRERGSKTTPAWTLDEVIGLIHEKPAGRFKRIGEAA